MTRSLLVATAALLMAAPAHAAGDALGGSPLWHVFNFVLFVAVVVYFARTPVKAFFAERHHTVRHDLDHARQELDQATSKLAECRSRLESLDRETRDLEEAVRDQAEAERERILREAEAAAERIAREAQAAIEQELGRARDVLRAEAAELAVAMAGRLLTERVTDEDRARLLDEFVTRVEQAPGPEARS